MNTQRDVLADAIAKRFPALLSQYSQFTVADFVIKHFESNVVANAASMVKRMGEAADTLRAERDAALEQARRDREYTAAQTGESVKLANQVLALHADLAEWKQALARAAAEIQKVRAERDALAPYNFNSYQ